jgi:hypothetical protein
MNYLFDKMKFDKFLNLRSNLNHLNLFDCLNYYNLSLNNKIHHTLERSERVERYQGMGTPRIVHHPSISCPPTCPQVIITLILN